MKNILSILLAVAVIIACGSPAIITAYAEGTGKITETEEVAEETQENGSAAFDASMIGDSSIPTGTCETSTINYWPYAVYLPYNYDENQQYNVIFIVAGGHGNPYWKILDDRYYRGQNREWGRVITWHQLYDYLIYEGFMEPCIIVSMKTCQVSGRSYEYYVPFMQWVVDNYSTYAESSEIDDIVAARDHFAIIGASNGAQSICISIRECPDFFAYYGIMSGFHRYDETTEAFSQKGDIKYLMMVAGETDHQRNCVKKAYSKMSICENVEDSDLIIYDGYGHENTIWQLAFIEFVQHIFKN